MTAGRDPLDIFPHATEADWHSLVAKSVKEGAASLASLSDDGIAVGPLYPQTAQGAVIRPASRWKIIQRIDLADPDAARRQLSEDLAEGADGVEIIGTASETARGSGIAPSHLESVARAAARADTHLRLEAGPVSTALATKLVGGSGVASLTAAFDPLAAHAPAELTADAVMLARALDHHGIAGAALIADGRPWNDRGASEGEELAAVIAAFVAHLRAFDRAGYRPAQAAARIAVALSADTEQFLTIAKLRAARLLLARLIEACGLAPLAVPIHVETAWRMMTALDQHTNMLRATVAAFGAAVGGADSIAVLPFDSVPGPASALAHRLARNTQLLLLDEAHLARVGDAAAGSGAIEALTDALAGAAWGLFQSIEAEGGLADATAARRFAERVGRTGSERAARFAAREKLIVGSSIYPLADEVLPASPPDLAIHRLAEPFERERRG